MTLAPRILFLLVLACCAPWPVLAQSAAPPPAPAASPRAKTGSLGQPTPGSIGLEADVPTGAALRVALNKTIQVTGMPAEAHDIIVGNSDIADVIVRSPTEVFVVGRGLGQTNIQFRDAQGRTIWRTEVEVHIDTDALREALAQVLPDETGLKVAAVGDSIYLSGTVRTDADGATARGLARRFVKEDANLVNLIRVVNEQQVLLKVKVAEIEKSALKELGVGQVVAPFRAGAVGISASPIQPQTSTYTVSNGAAVYTPNLWTTFGGGALSQPAEAFSALSLGIGQLTSTLTMLESQNLVRTLEEPNLTAVSGETATMLAGGEFPVPVSVFNGQIAIDFKKFGVGLNFTPTVLDPGRISLKLQTEVSDVDKSFNVAVGNLTVYGLKVRRAGTVVEMPSGGSIMIAGLLQNNIASVASGFPGLMDVPVLGQLFRSNSFQHDQSELVVIVSAFIVQPTSAGQLTTGAEGFVPSSDLDRFLFDKLQEVYVHPHDLPHVPGRLQGPFGYVVQ